MSRILNKIHIKGTPPNWVTKLTGQSIKRSYKHQGAYCTKEGMDKFEEDWKCDGEAWWIHIN